jgi:hypothetical protein
MGMRDKFGKGTQASKGAQGQAHAPHNAQIVQYQQALVREHGGETQEVARLVQDFTDQLYAKSGK